MLPSKSKFAFEQSAEQLFVRNKKIYFWTFTFREVPWCDTWAMKRWHLLMNGLTRHFPLCEGLRVMELHKSHGIHFHAIINVFVPCDVMKRLGEPLGFGRMAVKIADRASVTYLSKYLTKTFADRNEFFGGRRRWGAIGGLPITRCKDLVYDGPMQRNKKLLFSSSQVGYKEFRLLCSFSDSYGLCAEWPLAIKMRFLTVLQSYGRNTDSIAKLLSV